MKLSAHTTFSTGLDAEHFLRDVAVGYRYRYAETRFALRSFPIPGIQLQLSARTERTVRPCPPVAHGDGVGWGFYLLDRNLRHMSPDYFWA